MPRLAGYKYQASLSQKIQDNVMINSCCTRKEQGWLILKSNLKAKLHLFLRLMMMKQFDNFVSC